MLVCGKCALLFFSPSFFLSFCCSWLSSLTLVCSPEFLTAFASPRFLFSHLFPRDGGSRLTKSDVKSRTKETFPTFSRTLSFWANETRLWAEPAGWSLYLYIFLPPALIPALLLLVSLGVIAQLCFILPRRNCVMRSRKYTVASPWKDERRARHDTSGKPLPCAARHRLHASDTGSGNCRIIRLMPRLHGSRCPASPPLFLLSQSHSVSSSSSSSSVLISCLSVSPRASIVQKRVIYFQDEGSLTIRLCEKGNDGCLSSPQHGAHLFMLSSLITEPLSHPSLHHHHHHHHHTFEEEHICVFYTGLKM